MLLDDAEIENFKQTSIRCSSHYDSFTFYETGKSLQLKTSDFIECFAISAFLQTKQLHMRSRKTYMIDIAKQLETIQKKATELADLINSLPVGGVREWFDVGDKAERIGDLDNPAALQCYAFANCAKYVLENEVKPIPVGYYNPFLREFLCWYCYALHLRRTESISDLHLYVRSCWQRDRVKIRDVFAQVVCLGLKSDGFRNDAKYNELKNAGDTFDNNVDTIFDMLKPQYFGNDYVVRTTQ